MKRFFVIFLAFIFSIPGVKADECVNLFHGEPGNSFTSDYYLSENGTDRFRYGGIDYVGKDLTIYALKDNVLVDDLTLDVDLFLSVGGMYKSPKITSFTRNVASSSSTFYLSYRATKMTPELLEEINTWQFWVVEGDSVCIPTVDPNPPVPIDPVDPDQANVVTSFYILCIDKINLLCSYVLDNYVFMFCFGVTIFVSIYYLIYRRHI